MVTHFHTNKIGTKMKLTFQTLIYVICLLILGLYAESSQALNNVLDQIEVQESPDRSIIKILFTDRLIYRSHAPEKQGDLLHINLNFQSADNTVLSEIETLPWKPNDNVPLYEVTLSPANQIRAELVLRFNKSVEFDVQGSSDGYSLIVTVYHPQQQSAVTTPYVMPAEVPELPPFQPNPENEVLAGLMEEARQAMAKQDYDTAIRLYTKVLGNDQSVFAKQALEYLGVAREKNKQLAHAKRIYEQFLKRYPKGEDAERVQQRLAVMISASEAPKPKLRAVAKQEKEAAEVEMYGGFSQLYSRNIYVSDATGSEVTLSDLRSDLDFTARMRTQDYNLTGRFTGGHTANFLSASNSTNEKRLSSFYIDAKDKIRGASLRLGRQSRTSGGVLGRFDGLFGDYQLTDKLKLNLVTGYPVDSSRDVRLMTERYFYGASMDIGTLNKAWDFNVFAINQQNDGFIDRRAIGGEARYFDSDKSFFTLLDYDVFYNAVNMVIFNGRWSVSNATTLNMNYDYRKSPILTTRNALNGQTVTHLQSLLQIYPESTIYDLAQDRTADSHMLFTGITHQLSEQFQISGDIRFSKFSNTPASGGVLAVDGTDLETEYSLQLTGTSLLKEGDLALLTTTYSDLTNSNVITILINTRYPITNKLRINPKFKFRNRDISTTNTTQTIYSPSLQLTYRYSRKLQFEAEINADFEYLDTAGISENNQNYYILFGYRYDF